MRKKHNLGSYVGFIDLVKAYDTANHNQMFRILEKYGAPTKFVNAIQCTYKDLAAVLKIIKCALNISSKKSACDKATTWLQ